MAGISPSDLTLLRVSRMTSGRIKGVVGVCSEQLIAWSASGFSPSWHAERLARNPDVTFSWFVKVTNGACHPSSFPPRGCDRPAMNGSGRLHSLTTTTPSSPLTQSVGAIKYTTGDGVPPETADSADDPYQSQAR